MQGQTSQEVQASTAASQDWTAYRLLQLNHRELCELFRGLEPPTIQEMNGEYRLSELAQQSLLQRVVVLGFNIKSAQLCKAFEPTGPDTGHGYNGVATDHGMERKMFFDFAIRASRVDQRDSLHITYDRHNPNDRVLRSIVDELRKVKDGLYLGLGYAGQKGHERVLWPFMLEGPEAPFAQGTVG